MSARTVAGVGVAVLSMYAGLHAQAAGPVGDEFAARAIEGNASSARHCVAGYAANVHEVGGVEAGQVVMVQFDADIPLYTGLSLLNLEGDKGLGGFTLPDSPNLAFRMTEAGTAAFFVGGNGRTGCYRYKLQIVPRDAGAAAVPPTTALPRLVSKPAKNPVRTRAITGQPSSGKHCIAGAYKARVHDLGRIEAGTRVRIAFESDFDPIAGVDNVDVVVRKSLYAIDDDSGGDLEPLLAFTASGGGTLALHVASADGRAGCYSFRVELDGGAAPDPTPSPTPAPPPAPAPPPSPGPSPSPTPGAYGTTLTTIACSEVSRREGTVNFTVSASGTATVPTVGATVEFGTWPGVASRLDCGSWTAEVSNDIFNDYARCRRRTGQPETTNWAGAFANYTAGDRSLPIRTQVGVATYDPSGGRRSIRNEQVICQ
jgi:hypothetical protein